MVEPEHGSVGSLSHDIATQIMDDLADNDKIQGDMIPHDLLPNVNKALNVSFDMTISTLTTALCSVKHEIVAAALEQLWVIGDRYYGFSHLVEASVAITSLLKAEDGSTREGVAWLLGSIGDKRNYTIFLNMMSDTKEQENVRAAAAHGLGRIGDTGALDQLILALEDSSKRVRFEAVDALGAIGDQKAVPYLTSLLDRSIGVARRHILYALSSIQNKPS